MLTTECVWNDQLATYFCHLADPEGDLSWSSYHRRGMSEVAHHQTQARMWKELDSTLCDLAFIETKCTHTFHIHSTIMVHEPSSIFIVVSTNDQAPWE